MKKFLKNIINSKDPSSARRFITLIVAGHFILTSFIMLFLYTYMVFYVPKGSVNKDVLISLDNILERDFYIILSGLGFIAVDSFGSMMVERAKILSGLNNIVKQPEPEQPKID